ncbi:MAG: oxaloacetate decarboxylase [Beijerinckiaceae bacterium]
MTTANPSLSPRLRLRQHLAGSACIRPASVFDPVSGRLAESIGFEAGMYAGSVSSLVVLGAPDIILLTLSEFAAQARRICRASTIPLICDADHGYGNALNVMRTVEELENAGVAGLTIEDTDLPRPFGVAKPRPLPLAEGLGKVRAALAARQDPGLCLFARTGALSMTGLDDMLERLNAYQDTGVDGVFLTGATQKGEIEAIAKAAKIPVLLGAIGPEIDDSEFLAAHGVRIALLGHQPFMSAIEAIRACMQAQRDGTALPAQPSKATMQTVTRTADYQSWTDEFL